MILLELPVEVEAVEKKMTPEVFIISDPSMLQYSTKLPFAELINLMVDVRAVFELLRFEIVSEFVPSFNPFMVTALTVERSINGLAATVPEIVRAPLGLMVKPVHIPAAPVRA